MMRRLIAVGLFVFMTALALTTVDACFRRRSRGNCCEPSCCIEVVPVDPGTGGTTGTDGFVLTEEQKKIFEKTIEEVKTFNVGGTDDEKQLVDAIVKEITTDYLNAGAEKQKEWLDYATPDLSAAEKAAYKKYVGEIKKKEDKDAEVDFIEKLSNPGKRYYLFNWVQLKVETSWQNDYNTARQLAAAQKRPMAIVFGSGANQQAEIVGKGLGLNSVLASDYLCVYIDVTTAAGRQLADNVCITGSVGMVVTDRGLNHQAFWHQGGLENVRVGQYLRKYADPLTVVDSTETVAARANLARSTPAPAVSPTQVAAGQ